MPRRTDAIDPEWRSLRTTGTWNRPVIDEDNRIRVESLLKEEVELRRRWLCAYWVYFTAGVFPFSKVVNFYFDSVQNRNVKNDLSLLTRHNNDIWKNPNFLFDFRKVEKQGPIFGLADLEFHSGRGATGPAPEVSLRRSRLDIDLERKNHLDQLAKAVIHVCYRFGIKTAQESDEEFVTTIKKSVLEGKRRNRDQRDVPDTLRGKKNRALWMFRNLAMWSSVPFLPHNNDVQKRYSAASNHNVPGTIFYIKQGAKLETSLERLGNGMSLIDQSAVPTAFFGPRPDARPASRQPRAQNPPSTDPRNELLTAFNRAKWVPYRADMEAMMLIPAVYTPRDSRVVTERNKPLVLMDLVEKSLVDKSGSNISDGGTTDPIVEPIILHVTDSNSCTPYTPNTVLQLLKINPVRTTHNSEKYFIYKDPIGGKQLLIPSETVRQFMYSSLFAPRNYKDVRAGEVCGTALVSQKVFQRAKNMVGHEYPGILFVHGIYYYQESNADGVNSSSGMSIIGTYEVDYIIRKEFAVEERAYEGHVDLCKVMKIAALLDDTKVLVQDRLLQKMQLEQETADLQIAQKEVLSGIETAQNIALTRHIEHTDLTKLLRADKNRELKSSLIEQLRKENGDEFADALKSMDVEQQREMINNKLQSADESGSALLLRLYLENIGAQTMISSRITQNLSKKIADTEKRKILFDKVRSALVREIKGRRTQEETHIDGGDEALLDIARTSDFKENHPLLSREVELYLKATKPSGVASTPRNNAASTSRSLPEPQRITHRSERVSPSNSAAVLENHQYEEIRQKALEAALERMKNKMEDEKLRFFQETKSSLEKLLTEITLIIEEWPSNVNSRNSNAVTVRNDFELVKQQIEEYLSTLEEKLDGDHVRMPSENVQAKKVRGNLQTSARDVKERAQIITDRNKRSLQELLKGKQTFLSDDVQEFRVTIDRLKFLYININDDQIKSTLSDAISELEKKLEERMKNMEKLEKDALKKFYEIELRDIFREMGLPNPGNKRVDLILQKMSKIEYEVSLSPNASTRARTLKKIRDMPKIMKFIKDTANIKLTQEPDPFSKELASNLNAIEISAQEGGRSLRNRTNGKKGKSAAKSRVSRTAAVRSEPRPARTRARGAPPIPPTRRRLP